MSDRARGAWLILLGSLLAAPGCSQKDAERIGLVSGKALAKAGELTANAGAQLGIDLRKAQADLDELQLAGRIQVRLKWDRALQGAHIQVRADGDNVTLTGQVESEPQRQRALELAQSTEGVTKVHDALETGAGK
jgi:osmotically-inducible protein OsmY